MLGDGKEFFSLKPAVGKLIKQIIPLNNYNYLESNL